MAAVCALASGSACAACAKPAPAPEPAPIAVVAEFAGCAAVRRGPVCEVTPSTKELRVWVQAIEGAAYELRLGGAVVPVASSKEIGGGTLLTVAVPTAEGAPATDALKLTVTTGGGRGEKELRIERVGEDAALKRVQELRQGGKLDEAQAAMPAVDAVAEPVRGRAVSLQARLALAKGKTEEAERGLRAGMEMHRREGRVSDEVLDAMALAHVLLQNGHRIVAAREALESVDAAVREWDEGRAQLGYYLGRAASVAGNWRVALREFQRSDGAAKRLGLDSFRLRTRPVMAMAMQASGDTNAAVSTLRDVEALGTAIASPCDRADLAANRGWLELLAYRSRDRGPVSIDERPVAPSAVLRAPVPPAAPEQAPTSPIRLDDYMATAELYQRECPKSEELANAQLNVAHAALEMGDLPEVQRRVAAVRGRGEVPPYVLMDLLNVEARAALQSKDYRSALARFDQLAAAATRSASMVTLWRAHVGRGDVMVASKREADAISAYKEAESLLDLQSVRVPINSGRAGFLADRERSSASLADLLIKRGEGAAAMAVLRRARARALRAAQRQERLEALTGKARQRWENALSQYVAARDRIEAASRQTWSTPSSKQGTLAADREAQEAAARDALDDAFAALAESGASVFEPSPPARDAALLTFHRGDGGQVWALLATDETTHLMPIAIPSGAIAADALAEPILRPILDRLAGIERLRVLPGGPLAGLDLHALPWEGKPLMARLLVEYAADLGGSDPARPERKLAAVVSDTSGDLAHAAKEGQQVTAALGGWAPTHLEGDAATREAIVDLLGRASLLHFAGHAQFDRSVAWESSLRLADDAELRVGDILALGRVPEVVVLNGCETGRGTRRPVADASLAFGFVAAGARAVIAAVRPVDDRLAEAMASRMYRGAGASGWEPVEAFRAAIVDVAMTMRDADWKSYRLITP
ncbi:MAG: CHAT domain-containing protein [Polyangiaceae bacterium]